ncbi:hypothetical protein [Luteibacter sp.]|uniref:hypothetical protein n=1 Tax=Luteibacter sp. TaxID=1886636 RepID=UPI003F7FC325
MCVAGPTGGSASSPPSQPSGCSVNGASAACAHASGDPAPTPPNPPITDPGAQSTGQGNFSATSPGGTIGISVGTFQGSTSGNGNGGTGTNPGNGSGDNGDGDKDCTAGKLCNDGYTDAGCDAVPATSGDPLLSQMAIEAHRQRCRDQATDAAIQGADKSQGEDHDPGEVFKSDDGAAPQFNDAGFLGGGGTCPGLPPIEYAGQSMSMDAGICQGGPLLAAFVLFCAYVTGAMIAARLTSGG